MYIHQKAKRPTHGQRVERNLCKELTKNFPIVNNHQKAIITKEIGVVCVPPGGCMLNRTPKRILKKQMNLSPKILLYLSSKDTIKDNRKHFPK